MIWSKERNPIEATQFCKNLVHSPSFYEWNVRVFFWTPLKTLGGQTSLRPFRGAFVSVNAWWGSSSSGKNPMPSAKWPLLYFAFFCGIRIPDSSITKRVMFSGHSFVSCFCFSLGQMTQLGPLVCAAYFSISSVSFCHDPPTQYHPQFSQNINR